MFFAKLLSRFWPFGHKQQKDFTVRISKKEPNICLVHTRYLLVPGSPEAFEYPADDLDNQPTLVRNLFTIGGITRIVLKPYEMVLVKGAAFSWDDIKPYLEWVMGEDAHRRSMNARDTQEKKDTKLVPVPDDRHTTH